MSIFQEAISFVDADLMTITEVAKFLHCSEYHLYHIPRSQLWFYRAGKKNLYFRGDVIRYVRVHCRVQPRPGVDELLSEIEADLLDSPTDGVRERSRRRTK